MKIEFIYTYTSQSRIPQEITLHNLSLPMLQDKDTLIKYALLNFPYEQMRSLAAITACIYVDKDGQNADFVPPDWYRECRGKIYFGTCCVIEPQIRGIYLPK